MPANIRACLKILSGAVFRWDKLIMNGYASGRKHSFWWPTATAKWFWRAKTLRAAWLLALGFVVAGVTARCGDAPPAPPRPKPKSTAAASLTIFRQAPRNFFRCGSRPGKAVRPGFPVEWNFLTVINMRFELLRVALDNSASPAFCHSFLAGRQVEVPPGPAFRTTPIAR